MDFIDPQISQSNSSSNEDLEPAPGRKIRFIGLDGKGERLERTERQSKSNLVVKGERHKYKNAGARPNFKNISNFNKLKI